MKLLGSKYVATGVAALAMSTAVSTASLAETLIVASPNVPEGFDGDALKAHTQNVVTQVYENLFAYAKTEVDGKTVLLQAD